VNQEPEKLYGVFYTDGGCMAAAKTGGWGIHGYTYNAVKPKTGSGLKDWFITPRGYISKKENLSLENRQRIWALLPTLATDLTITDVNVVNYYDVCGSILNKATNNLAELVAVIKAVTMSMELDLQHVQLFTDSQYVQGGYTDMLDRWQANGWRNSSGEKLANVAEWETLIDLKRQILKVGHTLTISWVRGHNGNLGNEQADFLATQGLISAGKGAELEHTDTHLGSGYWKTTVEVNRLFAHSRWYFNTSTEAQIKDAEGRYVYYIGNHGKDDDFLGKQMPDASFALLKLEQPEPVLELIRTTQRQLDVGKLNSIMIGRLDFLFRPKTYQDILTNGCNYIRTKGARLDLYDAHHTQLTKELRPPRLAFNIVDIMGSLEFRLNEVQNKSTGITSRVTDISSQFFITEIKNKKPIVKLKTDWSSAVKSITVLVDHPCEIGPSPHPITLTFGMDLPSRNALAALALTNPQIQVVCWMESRQAFRYATVIKCGNDYGIFAGYYSNIQLLV
jgi:ribonuclease HI